MAENYMKLSFEDALLELEEKYKSAGTDLEEMISSYELRKAALEEEEEEGEDDEEGNHEDDGDED